MILERIEYDGLLWLIEKMIEDNELELKSHRDVQHHQRIREETEKFKKVARYYRGELWLMDREEKLELTAALTSGDSTQEETEDGGTNKGITPDSTEPSEDADCSGGDATETE